MPIDRRYAGRALAASSEVTATLAPRAPGVAPSAPPVWQAGSHFSRYEIDSKLATGGMAEVWRARLKGVRGFEKRIVLKTMLPQMAARPDLVEMFINEATIASALNHPNVAHVFDFGQLEGRYFIAMEFVPGVTLRFAHKRMLARGERLPIAAALHVLIDVCEGLHAVHELADARGPLGLVHRDLSPDNVILSTSGTAKLIDFGAARATTRTPTPTTFVGKYRYAAPERVRRTDEDRRADVYSAGIILYECLTGVRPFEGPDAEIVAAMRVGRVCDPRERVPSLPARIAEAVMRATAPDRNDRFATARDLGDALSDCLGGLASAGKERDVTASLAALMDGAAEPVPVLIAPESDRRSGDGSTSPGVALCEVEIIEASGPIAARPEPPPMPAIPGRADPAARAPTPPPPPRWGAAPSSAPAVVGRRRSAERRPPDVQRAGIQHAVELFDRGIELRAAGRYGEALQAWERALALAPENQVYAANVARLRDQLNELRRAQRRIEDWPTS
ncbi:MAG TPA: protein kinase [Polyangia bacterium]|nr:protein kinase [Polyangia bacterium]